MHVRRQISSFLPFWWRNGEDGIEDKVSLRWPPTAVVWKTFNFLRKYPQKETNVGHVLIKHREAEIDQPVPKVKGILDQTHGSATQWLL